MKAIRKFIGPAQYAQALFDNLLQSTPASQTEPAYQLQQTASAITGIQSWTSNIQKQQGERYIPKFPGLTRILSKHSATLRATGGAK